MTPEQRKQELQLFTVLLAIFERAFVMYGDMSTERQAEQWHGWEEYIRSFCKRKNFGRAWKCSGATFDPKFQGYMQRAMASNLTP